MSEIVIDPAELEQVASLLRSVGAQLTEASAGVAVSCCCPMPAGISGYIDGELSAVQASLAAVADGYGAAADEAAARATLITQDQSSAGEVDATSAQVIVTEPVAPGVGIDAASVIADPSLVTIGGAGDNELASDLATDMNPAPDIVTIGPMADSMDTQTANLVNALGTPGTPEYENALAANQGVVALGAAVGADAQASVDALGGGLAATQVGPAGLNTSVENGEIVYGIDGQTSTDLSDFQRLADGTYVYRG